MAKKPSITTVASGYQSTTTINSNTQNLRDAFDNTLSLDGSTPNAMLADLDMNSNDIINVDKLYLSGLYIDGQPVAPGTLNYNGVVKETQIATSGQAVFNLTTMTYNPGINSLSVYVDGVYQNPNTYTENTTTRITFSAGLHVGAVVDFVALSINEITGAADATTVTYTPNAQSLYGASTITVKSALDQISNEGTGSSKVGFLQSGTGVTNRTVQDKLRDTVSVKDFGAVGDNVANDLTEIQAAVNSGATFISITKGTYNLGGGTLTIPSGVAVDLSGGILTNGTIACNNTFFSGANGLSESITLTGTIINETGVFFDWFTCEKSTSAQYNTFINSNNATFGAAPTISTKNRTILTMLMFNGHAVQFGSGIYPFDANVTTSSTFLIRGVARNKTLLWCPVSSFLYVTSGSPTYPYISTISIEAYNSVLKTKADTVNAIHAIRLEDSFFISYTDHTFWNDRTVAGGTQCPIYGSKIVNCAVYAGAGKGCFYDWGSNSNIYDNVVDQYVYFNGANTRFKGITKALLYNSSTRAYCNSNISYAGLEYVFYFDRPGTLSYFYAHNNVFEDNLFSFQAIYKASTSNSFLSTHDNFYIGNVQKENGYAYICTSGNTLVRNTDSPTPLYGDTIRNQSDQYIRVVTSKIDAGLTKYRLSYLEPQTQNNAGVTATSFLLTPSTELATLVGMESIYAADSANISFIQVTPSYRMVNSRKLSGGYGTTAVRPTFNLYVGYPYYDTTLNKPIVYDGTNWRDGAGTIV